MKFVSHGPLISRRYFVSGRVQGVGFRHFVNKHAQALGMAGYTRNLDDGRVEVYAIGTASSHDQLSGFLHKGPPTSQVRSVDVSEAAPERVEGFRIER
ncbi:MAG: acylphosphatase [Bryobacteraceae bacterium]|nr:acylphosphatase [Bryobacteraceae bacterium]